MKRLSLIGIGAALALLLCSTAEARNPRGSVSAASGGAGLFIPVANNAQTNWALAGVPGGIPNYTTQCGSALNPVAGVPSGTTGDNAHNIVAAIAACSSNDVVLLNPGTSTAISIVSFIGNTLTTSSGTGIAVGDVIICPGCQTATTVTAGSGTSWTTSIPPSPNSTVTSVAGISVVPYNVLIAESGIFINKSIVVRGGGTCNGASTAGPVCPVIINVYDGAIPSWSVSSSDNNTNCAINSTSVITTACDPGVGLFVLSPNANFNWGWGGACNTGTGAVVTGCGTFLAADIAQGATTIQVASTTNFLVGHWFLIDELPVLGTLTNPAGTNPTTITGPTDAFNTAAAPAINRVINPDASGGTLWAWSLFPNRVNAELHKITAIGAGPCPGTACTITFDSPVTVAFRQSGGHNSQVFWPTNGFNTTETPFLTGAGIENLSILRPGAGGVVMEFCTGCWIKNVEVGAWFNAGAQIRWSSRSTVTGTWFHHGQNLTNNGIEYPFSIDAASTEIIADNNIFNFGGKGMVVRAAGGGNVVANNYIGTSLYQQASIGNYFHDMSVNASHLAGSHHVLFEGNFGNNCDNDDTHGAAGYHTYFRNHCSAIRDTFVDPSNAALTVNDSIGQGYSTGGTPATPAPMRAAGSMAWVYWTAFAGNLLGTAGVTTAANGWAYAINAQVGPGQSNKGMFAMGWVGSSFTATDSNLNAANPTPFFFRNGDYDYVNAGIVDNAPGFSQSFPNSFYTSTQPAYFTGTSCTYPWPWIDVHTAPFTLPSSCSGNGLPAHARWLAGTPMVTP